MGCRRLLKLPVVWIVTLGVVQMSVLSIPSETREYCPWETFNATCRPDEVILMESARYGRMGFGRCMKEDHGSVGCNADVLPHVDRICSGRHTCEMTIPDATLHNIHPCPKELVPYLEARYSCVKVKAGNKHSCSMFGGPRLSGVSGYLASITPGESPTGTKRCPWKIQVDKGQTINLTLIHFGSPDKETSDAIMDNVCTSNVVVMEGNRSENIPVCKERERERVVYLSQSSTLSVFIQRADKLATGRFLLKYQAIGCPDISGIQNAVITRKKDTTIVKCNFTGETYFLSCSDSKWKGELNNCTRAVPWGTSMKVDKATRFPYGLLIVIGIGVALGVALGIILLFGILFCLRKRKEDRLRSHTTDPLLSQSEIEAEDNHINIYQSRKECGSIAGTLTRERVHQLQKAQSYIMSGAELHQQLIPHQQAALYPHTHADVAATLPLTAAAEGQQLIPCGHIECCSPDTAQMPHRSSFPNELERAERLATQQTSFITFKPDVESAYGRMTRTLERGASLDLIKDSEPAAFLHMQPETLVVECSCTLRHAPGQEPCTRSLPRAAGANTAV